MVRQRKSQGNLKNPSQHHNCIDEKQRRKRHPKGQQPTIGHFIRIAQFQTKPCPNGKKQPYRLFIQQIQQDMGQKARSKRRLKHLRK